MVKYIWMRCSFPEGDCVGEEPLLGTQLKKSIRWEWTKFFQQRKEMDKIHIGKTKVAWRRMEETSAVFLEFTAPKHQRLGFHQITNRTPGSMLCLYTANRRCVARGCMGFNATWNCTPNSTWNGSSCMPDVLLVSVRNSQKWHGGTITCTHWIEEHYEISCEFQIQKGKKKKKPILDLWTVLWYAG